MKKLIIEGCNVAKCKESQKLVKFFNSGKEMPFICDGKRIKFINERKKKENTK